MKNPILDEIKRMAITVLHMAHGVCAVADAPDKAIVHTFDLEGKTLKVTIEEID